MAPIRSRVSTLATLAAVSALFGCGGDDDDPIFPPPPDFEVSVVVEGTVLDLQAQPVFGTTVSVSVYRFEAGTGCTTQLVGPPATTNVTEEGLFARTIVYTVEDSGLDYIEACVTVEAVAPSGYFPDSRSNLRAQLMRRELGVVVVSGVDLVLEPTT